MPTTREELDPKRAAEALTDLLDLKVLTEAEFQEKHHLHDSVTGFLRYCTKVKSFVQDGKNHKLHVWLRSKLR